MPEAEAASFFSWSSALAAFAGALVAPFAGRAISRLFAKGEATEARRDRLVSEFQETVSALDDCSQQYWSWSGSKDDLARERLAAKVVAGLHLLSVLLKELLADDEARRQCSERWKIANRELTGGEFLSPEATKNARELAAMSMSLTNLERTTIAERHKLRRPILS